MAAATIPRPLTAVARALRDAVAGVFALISGVMVSAAMTLSTPERASAQGLLDDPDLDRVPVVLVPGWGDGGADLEPLRERLVEAGWPDSRLRVLAFRDPYGSSESHAPEIRRGVETLRGLTGADEVDVVAHSMGGLAVREYLRGASEPDGLRRVVFLGTPHRGTVAAVLAWGEGGREMVPGSPFLERLNDGPGVPASVEALAVRTPVDLRVVPGSSAMLPHARNVEVCCPTHQGLLDDPAAFREVRLFLLHGEEGLTTPDDTLPLRGEIPDWIEPGS